MNICIDCGKTTKGRGQRCRSCSSKKWHKEKGHILKEEKLLIYCLDCGKKISCGPRCRSCTSKKILKDRGCVLREDRNFFCADCGKKTKGRGKRCSSCAIKDNWKNRSLVMNISAQKWSRRMLQDSQLKHPSIYEKQFKKQLEDENIPFEWQKIIDFPENIFNKNYCCADFIVNSNVIVEIDGDSHQIDPSYDEKRDKICKDLGYKILRFTHEEIKNNLNKCIKILKSILDLNSELICQK